MKQARARSDNDNMDYDDFEILVEDDGLWVHWPSRNTSVLIGPTDIVFARFAAKMAELGFAGT